MKFLMTALLMLLFAGCGALNATESVPTKMDAMNEQVGKTNVQIAKTNAAIHNQTLAVALAEMMKPENTEYLAPAPLGMMPAGQVFATEATADDLIKIVYVELTDINESQPDESLKDPATHAFPAALVQKVDHQKTAKLMAAMIVSGLAPQATINQIIDEQINQGGRYEDTAYQLLMLRYQFVHDILLTNSLFEHPLANPGKLSEAITRSDELDAISSLPYVSKISLVTTGMLSPDDQANFKVDAADTTAAWVKIDRAFDTDLDPKYTDSKDAQANEPAVAKAKAALPELRAKVKSHLPAQTQP